ncbi:MFS transporter [candidate division KSB1 bacterium]|nr:MFS transporter [candidate division KSB1 bacterium]RQW00878.1 MAG: MFS transporter [candidate division KSB1 bacterium]
MNERPQRSPWLFIPTLYFIEGLPYILINSVSIYMFKSFGVSNQVVGLTSIIMLPWVLKMLWSPVVDMYSSKRSWAVCCQLVLGCCFFGVVFAVHLPIFLLSVVAILIGAAFVSATHDIAADGYYMLALDKTKQAFFVGIRSTAYRIAMLAGGLIATFAGILEQKTANIPLSWSIAYGVMAVILVLAFFFHRWYLPVAEARRGTSNERLPFAEAFKSYFQQEKIVAILLFILLYRLGEAVLARMAIPFLLDPVANGGLGFSTAQTSLMRDVFGLSGLIVGGILAGWLIARFGLKKCIWPMALALNLPNVGYLYLAWAQPGLSVVYPIVVIEQFGYGVGFTAFMVFLMYIAKGPYKTSHYAISTGFMALGLMLPSMASGVLQNLLGYVHFFLLVLILTIPGFILLLFIPLEDKTK